MPQRWLDRPLSQEFSACGYSNLSNRPFKASQLNLYEILMKETFVLNVRLIDCCHVFS